MLYNPSHQRMKFRDDEHYATHRSRMLSRDLELRHVEAEAIAYCERGYSWAGAASEMGSGEGTVKNYVERAMCLYGYEIAENVVLESDDELPEYDRVSPDYFKTRAHGDDRDWVDLVMNYSEKLPAEFVEKVRGEAIQYRGWPRYPE